MDDHSALDEAVEFAAKKLGVSKLKKQQITALRQIVGGHDVFVNLPTGFGKSVIFQATPIIIDFLNNRKQTRNIDGTSDHAYEDGLEQTLIIVVLPLKALVVDQLDRVQKFGLKAADITSGIGDEVIEHVGDYSIIFASPESLTGARGKELLQLVKSRCFALFVDESHCVSKWGHSSGQSSAFRKCYGQLGEIRSVLKMKTSIIAMTATATRNVRKVVIESLGMRNYGLIEESPERGNIKYVVLKAPSKNWDDMFQWLCCEVAEKKASTERVIVYCQSRKQVGELYSLLSSVLPSDCHPYFNMYHTNTEDDVQRMIIDSFAKEDGTIRILFATIAFGMGIDVRGVHSVIMVGHPTDLDDLMQLSGRAGRDGVQSVAVLLDYPRAGAGVKTSDDMTTFLHGEGCRRKVIQQSFPSSHDDSCVSILKHNCCDICSKTCLCEGETCPAKLCMVEQQLHDIIVHGSSSSEECSQISVSESDKVKLTERIVEYRETLLSGTSCHLYTGGDMACGLSLSTIENITSECHIVFSRERFCDRYVFTTRDTALAVYDIVKTTLYQETDTFASEYLSDDTTFEDSEEEEDFSGGEYAEIVLYSSDSD